MNLLKTAKDIFIPVSPENQGNGMVEMNRIDSGNDDTSKKGTHGVVVEEDTLSIGQPKDGAELGKTHRRLQNRQIQMIGIGGTIGTSLFVAIGIPLSKGGPLSLLLAFIIWSIPILSVTASCAEMVCYLPIPSPFIRMAVRYVDEAFETAVGWNFWFVQGALTPFEVTLFNSVIHFWRDDYSPAITISVQIVAYFLINVFAVSLYGETEFWMSVGKVILAVGLMFFSFITMVGGNPNHDVYGFRNWTTPMAEYIETGTLGRFEGFLACLIFTCFTIAGPEYVSMVAGECQNPRKNLPNAYRQVAYRLTLFFIGGALCVGTVCSYQDPQLLAAIQGGSPGAGSSPYIVAMVNLNIKALPHIVNVLLLTSAFSAGNSFTYCSSRALYGMALDGKAPRVFSYCNKSGVPIFAVLLSLCWALLAFLQLGQTASTVLTWIINLVTSSQLITYFFMCIIYIHFYRAAKAQGLDRDTLPFKGWGQPYLATGAATAIAIMIGVSGYAVFLPGNWDVSTFLFNYVMVFINIAIIVVWKLVKKTKYKKPHEADLVSGLEDIELYEKAYYANLEKKQQEQEQENVPEGKGFPDGQEIYLCVSEDKEEHPQSGFRLVQLHVISGAPKKSTYFSHRCKIDSVPHLPVSD